MGAARFILQLSINMVIAMIAIVLVYVYSTKDTSKTQESSVVTSVITDTVPSYIESVETMDWCNVDEIITYESDSADGYATVVLLDGRVCYCDQAVAIRLQSVLDNEILISEAVFEIWTNNDNEHEIVCIN